MRKYIPLVFGVLLSLGLRVYLTIHGSEVADIHSLHEMGDLTLRGINPYLALNYNAYPPLALYLEIVSIKISQLLNIPFYITIKFWPNLADMLTAVVLYLFLIRKNIKQYLVTIWVLIFILNPISIIISAAHGQLDSVVSLFVILAILLLTMKFTRFSYLLSGLFIGLGIAIKPNPIMLLPFFLTFEKKPFRHKFSFLLAALAPTLILILPFLQDEGWYVIRKLFNYSGANDFGLSAIWRGFQFMQGNEPLVALDKGILDLGKVVFIVLLIILIFVYRNSGKLISTCLIAYLSFLVIYLGISAQYLSWILPLAILEMDFMIIPFSITGLFVLYGFYMYLNPTILISEFSNIKPFQQQFLLIYIIANLIFWGTSLFWWIKLSARELYTRR